MASKFSSQFTLLIPPMAGAGTGKKNALFQLILILMTETRGCEGGDVQVISTYYFIQVGKRQKPTHHLFLSCKNSVEQI